MTVHWAEDVFHMGSNTNIRCFHIYMTSKPATMDSCFGLVGPHQYGTLDTGWLHMQKMISLWTSLQTCGRWFICSKLRACTWTGHDTNASLILIIHIHVHVYHHLCFVHFWGISIMPSSCACSKFFEHMNHLPHVWSDIQRLIIFCMGTFCWFTGHMYNHVYIVVCVHTLLRH